MSSLDRVRRWNLEDRRAPVRYHGPVEDRDFIDRLLDGNPAVVETVRSWIRAAFVPYRRRFADDLEDLEQETLLQLIEALRGGRFQGRSKLATYVKSYIHHKAIDRLRAAGRREWVDLDELDLPSGRASAFDEMARSESVRIALEIVAEMPECQELWRMLREGMHYREMSERLGITQATLRVRVLRCRRRALEAREKLTGGPGRADARRSGGRP